MALAKMAKTDSVTGHVSRNMILAQEIRLSMNTRQTRRNLNILVIGGSGSGKTRFFVKPNLCEMPLNTSFVITDPSGELIIESGHLLEAHGYKVKIFNLVNMKQTYHYNPLSYLHEENDVIMLVDCILQNTTDPNKTGGDDFWEKAQALMLRAFTALLWKHGKELHLPYSISTFLDLMRGCQISEDESTKSSKQMCRTDMLFEAIKTQGWYFDTKGEFHLGYDKVKDDDSIKEKYPRCGEDLCTRYYDGFKQGAGKTLKSILISAIARLSTLESDDVKNLFAQDDIELDKIGDEKTALFITLPQDHDSFNFIAAMMYTQLFQALYYHAENECKGNYMICDGVGEVTKVFPIPHTPTEAKEIDFTQAKEIVLSKRGVVSEKEQSKKESHKESKKKEQEEEKTPPIPGVETGESIDNKDTEPDTDPGDPVEEVENKANAYAEKLRTDTHVFQIGDLFILKAPDEDNKCDASHGDVLGMYSDAQQAALKLERLKKCYVTRCGLYLPYHVTFMLDEFANIGQIPAFNKKLATMRKYEISCCIIVQAISQIKNMYKDDYETLIGNCDTILFLGSPATETLEYISKKLGKATIDVRNHSSSRGSKGSSSLSYNKVARDLKTPDELAMMPDSDCIVMIRGVYPYYGKKHQFTNHRNYPYTADASSENNYAIHPPKIKAPKNLISLHDVATDQMAQVMNENDIESDQLTETSKQRYREWQEKQKALRAAIRNETKESAAKDSEINQYNANTEQVVKELNVNNIKSIHCYPENPKLADLFPMESDPVESELESLIPSSESSPEIVNEKYETASDADQFGSSSSFNNDFD